MRTSVDKRDVDYKTNKAGTITSSIDTSYNLPDSFRTVDNTDVETIDLVVDDNGNIIETPRIDNSPKNATSNSNSINTGSRGGATTSSASNSTNSIAGNSSSSGSSSSPEVLDGIDESTLAGNSEKSALRESSGNMMNNSQGGKNVGGAAGEGIQSVNLNKDNSTEDSLNSKGGKFGTPGMGANSLGGAASHIDPESVQFKGELTPTGDDGSSDSSSGSSGDGGETTSSSHRQTESLAYYSNDWISIFETSAESGYNSVLDSNYFNNAYASTGAKLSKNTKYVR